MCGIQGVIHTEVGLAGIGMEVFLFRFPKKNFPSYLITGEQNLREAMILSAHLAVYDILNGLGLPVRGP